MPEEECVICQVEEKFCRKMPDPQACKEVFEAIKRGKAKPSEAPKLLMERFPQLPREKLREALQEAVAETLTPK